MELFVYYQNVRGLRTKVNHLFLQSVDSAYDIICLTETFLNSNIQDSELFCSNYSVYRRDRATTASKKLDGGGVLLAVRNNFAVA